MTGPAAAPIPNGQLLVIGSLTAFGPLCIDMYLPSLPDIGRDLHSSASTVQVSLTTCLLGLACGQLLIGPISDRVGRRGPLIAGLLMFIVASFGCALAPRIEVLILGRFLQGLGGAAGIVIARAMVRDLCSGRAAAHYFSILMTITGLGPIIAPQIGAGLLHIGSWRVPFAALAVAGGLLLLLAVVKLPETNPPERRGLAGAPTNLRSLVAVAADRRFQANALAAGFGFGVIFAYVAGSPFVLQNIFGLSPQLFSLCFAGNAVGLVAASQLNRRLIDRVGSARLLTIGLLTMAAAGGLLLVLVLAHAANLPAVLGCLFVAMSCNGIVAPNAIALALNDFPHAAGSASAVVGAMQYAIGGIVAPIVGSMGTADITPMAVSMAAMGGGAVALRLLLGRRPHLTPTFSEGI